MLGCEFQYAPACFNSLFSQSLFHEHENTNVEETKARCGTYNNINSINTNADVYVELIDTIDFKTSVFIGMHLYDLRMQSV